LSYDYSLVEMSDAFCNQSGSLSSFEQTVEI